MLPEVDIIRDRSFAQDNLIRDFRSNSASNSDLFSEILNDESIVYVDNF